MADQKKLLQEKPSTQARAHGSRRTLDRLASDPDSSHLINFPFALTVFLLLLMGGLVMSAGMIVPSAGATMIGFLITLLGAALYCGRLPEE